RKLYPMVKRILGNEEETKDALQELMIKLWNKRQILESLQNKNGYVVTVARNYCIDLKKKHKIPLIDNFEESRINVPVQETDLETREKLEHVHRIIEGLPEKYKEVLRLREIDGFSYDEIHQITGMEMPYIRVLLSRSRTKVREEMEKIYNYERGTCQPVE
ncbi:MAG: RNA polymerase sigma factor, partial [Deltaproteobacteria bacterium]